MKASIPGLEVVVLLYLVVTCFLAILGESASRVLGIWQSLVLVAGALVFVFWLAYTVNHMNTS